MEERKDIRQIGIRMTKEEFKELKQFCLDHDLTLTDAIKQGLELLKASKAKKN